VPDHQQWITTLIFMTKCIEAGMDSIDAIVLAIAKRIAAKPVTMSSAIYQDLGIGGDKAWELLTDVAKRFSTSFEGFEFASYFPEETEILLHHASKIAVLPEKQRRQLTVQHLVEVARKGKWFEPNSPPTRPTTSRPTSL
jgi:hypothetical protein